MTAAVADHRRILDQLPTSQLRRLHTELRARIEAHAEPGQPAPIRDTMRRIEEEARRRKVALCTACSGTYGVHTEHCPHR
ncbi:hypothetical protein ACIG5E_34195 [Kitasatospora sp. NPDC053057]|uniref:hypothetical protein n=1 Tax=Kitasatospora sp. NPDC053057 TaxID=3364062 RepID=UPI0037CAEC98